MSQKLDLTQFEGHTPGPYLLAGEVKNGHSNLMVYALQPDRFWRFRDGTTSHECNRMVAQISFQRSGLASVAPATKEEMEATGRLFLHAPDLLARVTALEAERDALDTESRRQADVILRMDREVAALREALEGVLSGLVWTDDSNGGGYSSIDDLLGEDHDAMIKARAALAVKP